MTHYLILFRSLSSAQRALRLLERAGLSAAVIKAPQGLSKKGCGYGVRLRGGLDTALKRLDQAGLSHGAIFRKQPCGDWLEAAV